MHIRQNHLVPRAHYAKHQRPTLSSIGKPLTNARKSQKKHVFLALAAGAWCLFSVTLLFSKVVVENHGDNVLIHVPHSSREQQQRAEERYNHDLTVPIDWNPKQSLVTMKQNFQPPFGFTMRDLARRVLSRHVANSNVLVVAPDAQQAFADYQTLPKNISLDSVEYNASKHSLGGTFVLHARDQGHSTHAMNAGLHQNGSFTPWTTTLDTWWSQYDFAKEQRRPNWILLAVVDPGLGWEDLVWRDSYRFLQESTITYIVTAVRSRFVNGTLQVYGIHGANTLLNMRYKMQVLQVSHYHVEFDETGDDKQQKPTTFHQYGPNALLKTTTDIESLLQWGAQAAERYSNRNNHTTSPVFTCLLFATQGLDMAIPSRRQYIRDDSRIEGDESWTQINLYRPVEFYPCPASATGLSVDINFDKNNQESDINVILMSGGFSRRGPSRFNDELSPWSRRMRARSALFRKVQNTWIDFRRCIHYFWNANTKITKDGVSVSSTIAGTYISSPKANERGIETHFRDNDDSGLDVWYDHSDPLQSEAACARYKDATTCETRIIPKRDRLWSSINDLTRKQDNTKNLDLLVIMLDPMSRGQLYRSMPQTKRILQELGFLQFLQYSAVGDNSGPNQAALYSGKSLADRDGITNDETSEWLWDTLRKAGYATLKGEDGCIENSNMLQSLEPNTTHGQALEKMFCFDFNRPNCLGTKPAASHLLQYGKQFINAYGSSSDSPRQPFAAFLHFVDSHEDTSTLSTLLDQLLAKFIKEAFESGKLANAMVMVISDHGLHYGPYFQTFSGRRERTEPLLYVRTPPKVRESSLGHIMESNAPLWTTPFDVYQTMLQLTVGRMDGNTSESLLSPLPETRKTCRGTSTIPQRFCDLHDVFAGKKDTTESCPKTPRPPSILSFYADIPKSNRPMLLQPNNCTDTQGETFDFESECICGTSHGDIHPCTQHPWGPDGINSTEKEEEYFAVIKCPNRVERMDSRVMRRQEFVDRYQNQTQDRSKSPRSPDILVLEIDSVSKAYAERHLPLTMQILRKHKLTRDNLGNLHCTDGICALDFERFAIVGANSVANQVPALSGCVVSRFHESCFKQSLTTDECFENGFFGTNEGCEACPLGTFPMDPLGPCNTTKDTPEKCCTDVFPSYNSSRICRDDTLFENGLQLFRRGPRRHTTWCPTASADNFSKSTPWLFDIARTQGYITYFGEEFCYDLSPYVTQDNTFPLYTDYEVRNLYCRLQSCLDKCEGPWPPMGPHICLERDGENPAFTQISDIWKTYPDVPKFAFLNGIAAHDYDFEWIKMIASLEAYDIQLVTFLERILYSQEFQNTIIVVRADHGLQGGPTTVEYSVQVEHREPWTQIIIPQDLAGDSLSTLATNQDRLATGFDLYHSFRNLMSSKDVAPMPDWSMDLFRDKIPLDRSCKEAKIPDDFCPCEGRGLDRAPHFGVCNVFEPYNDLFCASDLDPSLAPEKYKNAKVLYG